MRYFEERGHKVLPSSPLVPQADPTLLFTNAGMVQFKSVFVGEAPAPSPRAATVQKCLRAGGKHNDLENVGYTTRHHTLFEMLGNFSFGDYFKEDAIRFAWELITREWEIEKERLWATVYEEDEEAHTLWHEIAGMPKERIARLGEKDNFWAMGETGPCGPCSELVIDLGPEVGCRRPTCNITCECGRFLELWNLVFMQFNRDESGRLTPLPKPSIDTGMGLERVAAVLQGVNSNYDTDLFRPIIELVEELTGVAYGSDPGSDISMRVIADHSRALAFLIAEGVLPENEGRGYVLRRILRRAARHGRRLGLTEPFLFKTTLSVVDLMGGVYPELKGNPDQVAWVIRGEEERFNLTLDQGLRLLSEEIDRIREGGGNLIPGQVVFKLYDTYGFPTDLTQDIAKEEGLFVDLTGFDKEMAAQRERARRHFAATLPRGEAIWSELYSELGAVRFVGYDKREMGGEVAFIVKEGRLIEEAGPGEEVDVITPATPFYGEAGGQVGDVGMLLAPGLVAQVIDTQRPYADLISHRVIIREGVIRAGSAVTLKVDAIRRQAAACNHTATHLLHAALRRILGGHVKQSGSLVAPDRLRFDFTHYSRVNEKEMVLIEDLVNEVIRQNLPVTHEVVPFHEAMRRGAIAFFGEKYGDEVRMVRIGDFSLELCGGTHVSFTGEIGLFKFTGEGAIGAGMRRVEALTASGALSYVRGLEEGMRELAQLVKAEAEPELLISKYRALLNKGTELERELESLKGRLASSEVDKLIDKVREIKGIKVLSAKVPAKDPKELRDYGDRVRDKLRSGILLLGAESQGQALLLCMVTRDLTERFDASAIVKEIAKEMGGSGGGRREMAQGGGRAERLDAALGKVFEILGETS